jgi:hypothetical protein
VAAVIVVSPQVLLLTARMVPPSGLLASLAAVVWRRTIARATAPETPVTLKRRKMCRTGVASPCRLPVVPKLLVGTSLSV